MSAQAHDKIYSVGLNGLRANMERIDRKLSALLYERMACSGQFKVHKTAFEKTSSYYIPEREEESMGQIISWLADASYIEYIGPVYRAIYAASRAIQKRFKIGVYVRENERAEYAAIHHFGDYHQFEASQSFAVLLESLIDHQYDYLVIPSELVTSENMCVSNVTDIFTIYLKHYEQYFSILKPSE